MGGDCRHWGPRWDCWRGKNPQLEFKMHSKQDIVWRKRVDSQVSTGLTKGRRPFVALRNIGAWWVRCWRMVTGDCRSSSSEELLLLPLSTSLFSASACFSPSSSSSISLPRRPLKLTADRTSLSVSSSKASSLGSGRGVVSERLRPPTEPNRDALKGKKFANSDTIPARTTTRNEGRWLRKWGLLPTSFKGKLTETGGQYHHGGAEKEKRSNSHKLFDLNRTWSIGVTNQLITDWIPRNCRGYALESINEN